MPISDLSLVATLRISSYCIASGQKGTTSHLCCFDTPSMLLKHLLLWWFLIAWAASSWKAFQLRQAHQSHTTHRPLVSVPGLLRSWPCCACEACGLVLQSKVSTFAAGMAGSLEEALRKHTRQTSQMDRQVRWPDMVPERYMSVQAS